MLRDFDVVDSEDSLSFGSLEGESASKIALKSVSICGELRDLFFEHTISQKYKNETEKTLEIIYTFPLAWDTALLGMSAIIAEKELTGTVVPKADAHAKYEDAIDKGDSAIMVEKSAKGLYTANLGNIKPGETVKVNLKCVKLLRFEGDRVRLAIPTAISMRYGDSHGPSGLAAHESAAVDDKAYYEFSLQISLYGEIAKANVTCPSHAIVSDPIEGGIRFALDGPAALNRDFVLLIHGIANRSLAQYVTKDGETLVAASFAPNIPPRDDAFIALKILIDCSGSMGGSRIDQALVGLKKVVGLLKREDFVSYSRFGSTVRRKTDCLLPCSEENLERLTSWIENTYADLGGTEMNSALRDTFALGRDSELPGTVLLITDGDIWQVDEAVATAQKSGQRVFVIGVGSGSSEELLRNLAKKTGGACELVTANENIAAAVVRMFNRMRGSVAHGIDIDWQGEPIWKTEAPKFLYNGETVHCFALMAQQPSQAPVLTWHTGDSEHKAQAHALVENDSSALFRFGMQRRMDASSSKKEKKDLALKYQLVSDLTSYILTHERADNDKVVGLPTIQQVPQMPVGMHCLLAGGLTGYASAFSGFLGRAVMAPFPFGPMFHRAPKSGRASKSEVDGGSISTSPDIDIDSISFSLDEIVKLWKDGLYKSTSAAECLVPIRNNPEYRRLNKYFESIQDKLRLSVDVLWAFLIQWALETKNLLDRHSIRLLKPILANISSEDKVKVYELFDKIN